jgi:tetratricopeptide (TPR) repeat protein
VSGSRRAGPAIEPPEDADPRELAYEVRSQLRTLSKLNAEKVARHLVAAGRLVDEDPAAALQHARAARALGARVAVVREAVGETAYAAGEWAEAIAELRTARRMTGDDSALPMIADAERALGRADRALKIAQSDEAQALEPAERAEMRIVEAGARHDLGQLDAALLTLQDSGLDRTSTQPWSARVWYAYADLLLSAGREDEAREWFVAAAGADQDGSTDAGERILQLDGIEVLTDGADEDADAIDSADADADAADAADDDDAADAADDAVDDDDDALPEGVEDRVEDVTESADAVSPIESDDDAVENDGTDVAVSAEPEPEFGGDDEDDDEDGSIEAVGGEGGDTVAAELVTAEEAGTPDKDEVDSEMEPVAAEDAAEEPAGTPGTEEAPEAQTGNPIVLTFSDQSESGSSE